MSVDKYKRPRYIPKRLAINNSHRESLYDNSHKTVNLRNLVKHHLVSLLA